ncbi:MAG TPA: hypothetical protein PLG15_01310 [Candidatus Gastranaerophilaceae bacterium]|nr:hypothetical protein [Candidatus Gastranaerophilaceae bacterium]HPT41006.1 hypothetical protein [Candidatus Gastranaerophilaceae bacterium]
MFISFLVFAIKQEKKQNLVTIRDAISHEKQVFGERRQEKKKEREQNAKAAGFACKSECLFDKQTHQINYVIIRNINLHVILNLIQDLTSECQIDAEINSA